MSTPKKINKFHFLDCVFKPNELTIYRNDDKVQLPAKVAELFTLLIQRSPDVLSFTEAIELIWDNNEGVGKKGYTNAIWAIRKALKDLGVEEDVFATTAKVGYQFVPEHRADYQDEKAPNPLPMRSGVLAILAIAVIAVFVFAFVFTWLQSETPASEPSEKALEQQKVTNFEGVEEHIAISNSGEFMAFSWATNSDPAQVYITNVEKSTHELKAVSVQKGSNLSADWSPSDSHLAYVSFTVDSTCSLVVRNLLLDRESVITRDCHYVPFRRVIAWGASDEMLYYSKKMEDRVALFAINLTTDETQQVTYPDVGEEDSMPVFAKGNLYFVRGKNTDSSSVIIKADLSGQTLSRLGDFSYITGFDINKENLELYVNGTHDSHYGIHHLDQAGEYLKQLDLDGLYGAVDFSEARNALYLSNHLSSEYIARVKLGSGKVTKKVSSSYRDLYPSYLKSSDEMVFMSNRSGRWSLWKTDSKGLGSVNLTKDRGDAFVPSASPNGKSILVSVKETSDVTSLYLIDEQTNKFTKLNTDDITPSYVNWSLDSQTVIFAGVKEEQSGLFALHLKDQRLEMLTNTAEVYASPLSETELLVSRQNENGLWIFDIENKTFSLVSEQLMSYDFGAYYAKGKNIYFVQRTAEEDQVVRVTKDNLSPEIVLTYPKGTIRNYFGITAATDDELLATFMASSEADVHKVSLP